MDLPCSTLDLAVVRSFRITEKATSHFRAEAFNALNKMNLGNTEPLRQQAAIRNHHDAHDPRPRNPNQRQSLF